MVTGSENGHLAQVVTKAREWGFVGEGNHPMVVCTKAIQKQNISYLYLKLI